MKQLVEKSGVEVAFKEVDVVTTGTFGAMCSSGAIINIGHSDPPIKIENAKINNVPVITNLELAWALVNVLQHRGKNGASIRSLNEYMDDLPWKLW